MGRSNKKFSYEVKLAAVLKHLEGVPLPVVMTEFGITTRAMANKWVAAYRVSGPDGLKPKPRGRPPKHAGVETLEQKVARLEFENEALKKLQALVDLQQQGKLKL
jgi:transposase-like protein